jgi:hypothetical protein
MKHALATFLRNIPQSNQNPLPIENITGVTIDVTFFRGYVAFLQTLGVVEVVTLEPYSIRARSQTAKYTLNSLAEYVENDLLLINDWKTRGIQPSALVNGASFLKLLDEQRLAQSPYAQPSRSERVAQVLIKRENPATHQPELLFQFDHNATQFQLIGGRYSPRDNDDLRQTIIREIIEELPLNTLIVDQDYHLVSLLDDLSPAPSISLTFGALTRYHFAIYHMTNLQRPLRLQKDDAWLPIDDVLNGVVIHPDGREIIFHSVDIYHAMNTSIEGGFVGLANSFRHSG